MPRALHEFRHTMKTKTTILLLGLTLLSSGCHRRPHRKPVAPSPPPLRTFAVIARNASAPFNPAIRAGAMAAAHEIPNAQITWAAPKDASEQTSIIRRLISKHVNGIAISCADPDELQPAIDSAVDEGIPVVCFDSDSPDSKRASFFGVDDRAAGRKMGELLKAALPDGGDVAVLTGAMDVDALNERISGFKDAINGSKLMLVTVYPCGGDPAKAAVVVRDYNRSHPNIKGWAMVVGLPVLGPPPGPFAGANPGDVKVVAFDTARPELDYVRKGYVTALVGRKYYEWGHRSVKILDQLDRRKKVLPLAADDGLDVVTKDNVEAFARSAGAQ